MSNNNSTTHELLRTLIADVRDIKTDISGIKTDISGIKEKLVTHDKDIEALQKQTAHTHELVLKLTNNFSKYMNCNSNIQ